MNTYSPEMIRFLNLVPEPINAMIVCYPRSGSTYLGRYIQQRTMRHLKKSHSTNISSECMIVGPFRKPEDAISSFVSMEIYYQKRIDYRYMIDREIANYNRMLDFLINNADVMVDYDKIIKNPEESIKAICDLLGIDVKYYFDYIDDIEDIPQDKFLKSSKYLESYGQIAKMVSASDLSVSKNLYEKALKLSKTI
jgi:hypothetical protein